MNRKGWLRLLGAALTVLVIFNGVVTKLGRSQGEEMLRGLSAGGDFEWLFLGNSTMAHGFDALVFAAAAGLPSERVLKMALGGVSAEEECLLLEEFFARGNKVKQVVLGFHDLHLEGAGPRTWSSLSGAMNLIYFVPHERAQEVYHLSAVESAKVRITRGVPMLVRRSNLWARVEQLRRQMEGVGMSAMNALTSGSAADFMFYPYLESEREAAHERMASLVKSSAPLSIPVKRVIDLCQKHGTKLSVMEMPLRPERLAMCVSDARWRQYREYRQSSVRAAGSDWQSFLKWSSSEIDFTDPVHMTAAAQVRFSTELATSINPQHHLKHE